LAANIEVPPQAACDATSWTERWDKVKDLQSGAQSTAMEVRKKDSADTYFLKALKDQHISERRFRFWREAAILSGLEIVGVPRLVETNAVQYADKDYNLYLVTDLIKGEKLSEFVSEEFSARQAVEMTIQLCEILKAAHARGVRHRDIKPDNVVVTRGESTKEVQAHILDFGIAHCDDDNNDFRTKPDQEIGNRFLRLPEFAPDSEHRDDPRSDVTMLAGLFFYMLTGKKPAILEDHNGYLPHQRVGPRKRLDECGLNRDKMLSLFDKAFQTEIANRIQSIAELESKLAELLMDAQSGDESKLVLPDIILERLGRSSNQVILARRESVSRTLHETESTLRHYFQQFAHGIILGQTNRNGDPQNGLEETTLIFTLAARQDLSIRAVLRVNAVGPEAKVRVQAEALDPLNLRIALGSPLSAEDKQSVGKYLVKVLDVLTSNSEGVSEEQKAEFRDRAIRRANDMIQSLSETIAAYVELASSQSWEAVKPAAHGAKLVGNSAIAQASVSCKIKDGGGYLHIRAMAQAMVESWPNQELTHSLQTISATVTPGPTGSGPTRNLSAPAETAEPFRPSVEDIGALVAALMQDIKRDPDALAGSG
jgi:serine/threonine protein kinase